MVYLCASNFKYDMTLDKFVYKFLIIGILVILAISCRKDDVVSADTSLKLEFSADSVLFDTVFTSVGSVTKQLMIYNKSDSRINISNVTLGQGTSSAYRINLDGESGSTFSDIEIASKDSVYVFVRVTIDPLDEDNPYVVEDDIYFLTNGNEQSVKLVAWGQDANYIVADTYIDGLPPFKVVADSLETVHWTSDRPYVIYGYAVIDSYGKLVIEEGTQVHFHENGGLWAYAQGVLNVLGSIDNPVVFQGDRLEDSYDNLPGQWDRIWLMEGRPGEDHIIENAVIRNGFIGIQAESFLTTTQNMVRMHNVKIENMEGIGVFSRIFNTEAFNLVVGNCGGYNIAITGGGFHYYAQSSIGAYWTHSVRNTPALFLNNYLLDTLDNPVPITLNLNLDNSIVYGINSNEFETDLSGGADSLYYIKNSILKTSRSLSNDEYYTDVIVNEDPLYLDPLNNDYRIDTLSPAINTADEAVAAIYPKDILNNSRLPDPDMGAYQFIPGQDTIPLNYTTAEINNSFKMPVITRMPRYPKIK